MIPEGEDGVTVVVEVHHQPVKHKYNHNYHIIINNKKFITYDLI